MRKLITPLTHRTTDIFPTINKCSLPGSIWKHGSIVVHLGDSPNGTIFLTIVVYDKQKIARVDDPSDLITRVDCLWARKAFWPGSTSFLISYNHCSPQGGLRGQDTRHCGAPKKIKFKIWPIIAFQHHPKNFLSPRYKRLKKPGTSALPFHVWMLLSPSHFR
jgi:hypothetical protein